MLTGAHKAASGNRPPDLLVEQLQVPRTREKREPERFVGCAGGCMAGVAARSHGSDVHSAPTHVIERVSVSWEASPRAGTLRSGKPDAEGGDGDGREETPEGSHRR